MGTTVETTAADLKTCFANLEDPRNGHAQVHELLDMIIIAICASICGADCWTEVEAFGKAKLAWLRTFLALPGGIPSHDTFGRLFRYLDPEAFVLGQSQVDAKSNEITAIPELLRKLDVAGCIVSIDAIGTQKDIAAQIVAQEGDYVLALKENQPHLREDVQSLFTWADNRDYEAMVHAYHKDTHKGHGRLETRECWTISDPSCIAMLAGGEEWANLRTVVRVRAERQVGATRTTEVRYYISSLPDTGPRTAEQVLQAVHSHLDGFELKLLHPPTPEDFRDVISGRYERSSILLASNRELTEWPDLFHEPLLASVELDRLTHGAQVVIITGSSYPAHGETQAFTP